MKVSNVTLITLLSCSVVASPVLAQTLRHPASVQPVSLTYDYYGDEESSPSDVAPIPAEPAPLDASAAQVDTSKDYDAWGDSCKSCGKSSGCCSCYLLGDGEAFKLIPDNECRAWTAGFWTQVGYHTAGTNGDGTGLFNNYPNRVQLQQQWAYLEKAVDTGGCGFDWGFRVDYVYGTDGPDTQGFGGFDWDTGWTNGGAYGHAIPQAYMEFGYNRLKAKVGHFFTIVGYEVVTAPDNFFYSHAFTMYNAEPFTHTGVLLEYELVEDVTVWGGWTQGWDTGFEDNGGNTFLGGFSLQLTDNLAFTYTTTLGDFGYDGGLSNGGAVGSDDNGYSHSIVMTYDFRDKWTYVLQSDLIDNDVFLTGGQSTQDVFGVNQYLMYQLNDCWAMGVRGEWYKDPRIGAGAAGEVTAVTVGANWRPHANVVFRPEVRWEDYRVGNADGRRDQAVFGIDAILTY
jgi:hypothetical protein